MKRLSGFSLMEMMIVLTIIAIVAAASAPMVNKKMVVSQSNENIWSRAQDRNSIFFNDDGANNSASSVRIGSRSLPWGSQNPRLYIRNRAGIPHMEFSTTGGLNNPIIRLYAGNNENIWFATGNPADGVRDSVALGFGARATNLGVTIGANANSGNNNASVGSVVIGNAARNRDDSPDSVVIGNMANAGTISNSAFGAISIGSQASANNTRSIAIGRLAEATGANSIAIGSSGDDSEPSRSKAFGDSSIAIGPSSVIANNQDSIAIGKNVTVSSNKSIAIANDSERTTTIDENADDSILIGSGATVENGANDSIVIGAQALSRDPNSIVIGAGAGAKENTNHASDNLIAIGAGAGQYVVGCNKICIGNNSGPSKNMMYDLNSNETIYIGSAPKNLYKKTDIKPISHTDAVLEIVNKDGSKVFDSEKKGTKRNCYMDGPTVYINGNLNVRGYIGAMLADDRGDESDTWSLLSVNNSTNDNEAVKIKQEVNKTQLIQEMSDRRLKNVGKAFVGGLAELKKLDLYNYTFKDDKDKTPRVGVMAQDLQKIFPDAVFKGDDGFLRIRMEDMFYAVINAVKELDLRISSNSKKIEELEKQNQELLKQNEELFKRIEALEKAKK